jgi:sterol desaturase/sphingolipid hydroxylase (fatty acid hydroxylase superfamily)
MEMPPEIFDATYYATPLFIAAIFYERRRLQQLRAAGSKVIGYEKRDTWTSIFAGLLSTFAWIPLNMVAYHLGYWLWAYRVTDLGTGPLAWAAALLGWDFAFYWFHRCEHEVRFMWAGHVTHHSSRHYNLSTALRQSWTPLLGPLFYAPLSLLGVRPELMLSAASLNLVYQFWIHTEAIDKLPGWYEFIFNTPSHHRVHHGSNPQYLDRNHAGVLIVWDRLFGTFEAEGERVVYGLTRNVNSFNPIWVQLHEYVQIARDSWNAPRWADSLSYVLRGPGWSPPRERRDAGINGTTV